MSPSELALAWRRADARPLVRGYAEACPTALAGMSGSAGSATESK
ncbi:hypothetical protein [Nocardia jinanensis]|nr:hypothetical protein [Nocardia jinanensis]